MNEVLRQNILDRRFGHAYLFLGEKKRCEKEAAAFAAAVCCESPKNGEACNDCPTCLRREENFPELITLEPEKKNYTVRQIGELMEYLSLSVAPGGHRVFWFKEADRLGEICSNKLLKSIEEPTEGIIFLLTAENDDRIVETILSRCRIVHINEDKNDIETDSDIFHLLCLVKKESFAYLFRAAEKYGKERSKEEVAAFFEAAAKILGENYSCRRGGERPRLILAEKDWREDDIFSAWQWALSAPILLDHAIQHQLIIENFLLDIKRNGGQHGNDRWRTL